MTTGKRQLVRLTIAIVFAVTKRLKLPSQPEYRGPDRTRVCVMLTPLSEQKSLLGSTLASPHAWFPQTLYVEYTKRILPKWNT